eukprot:Gregarina_sp_Poly_1__3666@NODE_207_length_11414_cov_43_030493_g184_i0_p15_GENE_NODE_207_length_11414_cov_43_030493_g184_i0NODE_207_length_11414_cov_43_030493_g184_i0_p15_ORF_typecomplete_len101_score11_45_NODE_207_length_11414_cov_43_030493_g184_i077678069
MITVFVIGLVPAASQLVPHGALTATGIRLVSDPLTHKLPTLQFGDVDADAFKLETTTLGELVIRKDSDVYLSFSPVANELSVQAATLRVEKYGTSRRRLS